MPDDVENEPRDPFDPGVFTQVRSGDRRKSLEAVRDYLAAQLEEVSGRDAAVVARELRDTMKDLDSLGTGEEVDDVDEIAEQRRRRRSAG